MNWSIEGHINIRFAIALLAVAIAGVIAAVSVGELISIANWVEHTHEVIETLQRTQNHITDAQDGARGFAISGQEELLGPYREAAPALTTDLTQLKNLVADNPVQRERAERLDPLIKQRLGLADQMIEEAQASKAAGSFTPPTFGRGRVLMDQIRSIIKEMQLSEQQLLSQRLSSTLIRARTTGITLGGGILLCLGLAFVALKLLNREIERRKQAQARLSETLAMQQAILDSANYSIVSVDKNGVIRSFNRGAEVLVGYTAEEVVGKATPELIHDRAEVARRAEELSKELGEEVKPGFDTFIAKARHGRIEESEWTYIRKDGSTVPVLVSVTAVRNQEGQITGYTGIGSDISERKEAERHIRESEERYRELFENASDVIVSIAVDGSMGFLNPAGMKLLGYSNEELEKLSIFDLVPTETLDSLKDSYARVLRGEILERVEGKIQTRDGRIIEVEGSAAPSFRSGELSVVRCILRDVTEAKRIQNEVARARDAALESARLKSEFLANMSHEIRTPMNGIVSMGGLLLGTTLNPEQRRFAGIIQTSADSLLAIIDDILDFSKIEAGKLHFEQTDFDLEETVYSALDILGERAYSKDIELTSLFSDDVPSALIGDPLRLKQVLTNLVGNAIKFTDKGYVIVKVSVERDLWSKVVLRFSVTDTGIGISTDAQRFLFQPFSQADGSTTRRFGGTGLGLAISKQLVELMNGEIGVTSEPGAGSTFFFTARFQKQEFQPVHSVIPELVGVRALIADDSPASRAALSHQVSRLGMTPDCVDGGTECLQRLKIAARTEKPYAIAILDTQMPDIDGPSLIKMIRSQAEFETLPLILLSASAGRKGASASPHGANAVVAKPTRQTLLTETILKVISGRRSETANSSPRKDLDASTVVAAQQKSNPKARILIAEDNPINQTVALELLKKLGYTADVVADGREALETTSREPYDLVLMDCQMPLMDGFQATSELRKREGAGRRTIVIAMTASALKGDREKCLDAGMDDYIAKPMTEDDLAVVLSRWVDNQGPPVPDATTVAERPVLDAARLSGLRKIENAGEHGFVAKLIDLFLRDAPSRIKHMTEAAANRDMGSLARTAHSLKGSAGSMGALKLMEVCSRIEDLAREDATSEVLKLLDALDSEFRHVQAEMERLKKQGQLPATT